MISIFSSLLDVVFPPLCLNCGACVRSGETICESCFAAIPLNPTLFCGKCRARLPRGERICHYDFPYLLGAAADYDDPAARNLIHALKFEGVKRAALPLSRMLVNYFGQLQSAEKGGKDWTVIPMPLGKRRQRSRGYNQAAEIAKPFAGDMELTYQENTLIRTGNAPPQTELGSLKERVQNVKGRFAITELDNLRGKRVILVDDVTTSGATFLAAAEALKSAGAGKILALAAAKA